MNSIKYLLISIASGMIFALLLIRPQPYAHFPSPIADTGVGLAQFGEGDDLRLDQAPNTRLPRPNIPNVASQSSQEELSSLPDDYSELENFIKSVASGDRESLTGVFVEGLMELRIVPQPLGDVGFISIQEDTVTQFQSPSSFGVVGLLAHNYLSGKAFHQIQTGQQIILVYGDGRISSYQVKEIAGFERLTNGDLRSDFRSLQDGDIWTADQVFDRFYTGNHHLTLQTCIEESGVLNWGVKFIVAQPIDE